MLFCLQIPCNMNYQSMNLIHSDSSFNSLLWVGFFSGFPTGVENMRETVPTIGEALQNLIGDFSQYISGVGEHGGT